MFVPPETRMQHLILFINNQHQSRLPPMGRVCDTPSALPSSAIFDVKMRSSDDTEGTVGVVGVQAR